MRVARAGPLAALLARSFYDDPVARWVDPDDRVRLSSLTQQFELLYCEVFVHRRIIDVAGDPPIAQAVWSPPGTWQFSEAEDAAMAAGVGDIPGDRGERVDEAFAAIDDRHPPESHWYLDFLGVDPDHQGSGHGGGLLAHGLQRCDATGEAAYLWTANSKNLPFYGRFGFSVIWEDVVAAAGPQVWGLWRPPAAATVDGVSPPDRPTA